MDFVSFGAKCGVIVRPILSIGENFGAFTGVRFPPLSAITDQSDQARPALAQGKAEFLLSARVLAEERDAIDVFFPDALAVVEAMPA